MDKKTIGTGIGGLIVGGALMLGGVATGETVTPIDDGRTAKESVEFTIETPTVVTKTYTIDGQEEIIVLLSQFRAERVASYNAEMAEIDLAITENTAILTRLKAEADKLPARTR